MTYSFDVYEHETGNILMNGEIDDHGLGRAQAEGRARAEAMSKGIDFMKGDIRIRILSTDPLARKLTIEAIMDKYGMTQTALSKRFGIPYRTIQNWRALGKNRRECPEYVLRMMEEILEAEKE